MRAYSNFLLFEDFLDYLPEDSSIIFHAADTLISPQVKIAEEDCGTLLGSLITLNSEAEGLIELATGDPLTASRIDFLLGQGVYQTFIRKTASCTSEGGICRKCYEGKYTDQIAPEVGTLVSLQPEYDKFIDVVVGDGMETSFSLTQSENDFPKVLVFHNGEIVSSGFTITDTTITFSSAPTLGQRYVVKFFGQDSSPLLGFFAKTFSGGLLGIAELPTRDLLVRQSLYESLLSDTFLDTMLNEISGIKVIPPNLLEFVNEIHSKLEKALYIIYLYSVYASIEY